MICGIGKVPVSGIPNAAELNHVQETWISGTGNTVTMFVSLLESESDSDAFKFSIGCDGTQTVTQIVPKEAVYDRSVFNLFSIGHGEAFSTEPDKPFVVFYQSERTPNQTGEIANGVVVWVVPVN